MAIAKTRYYSKDNKGYDTELEADARDRFLEMQGSIEAYIVAAGLKKAQAGLMRKHLSGFSAFLSGYKPTEEDGIDAPAELPAE
jgi:hypothetical protein